MGWPAAAEKIDHHHTMGQSGEISQNLASAYECAFGSEVAKTTERMQGTSELSMFLKSICEQNSIS